LWASTGTKNPDYPDLLYVEKLIAPGVVNTMPIATLEAFDDHGDPDAQRIDSGDTRDDLVLAALHASGLDLDRITATLEREGVEAFSRSYDELIASIGDRLQSTGR
jgi:transaldolase